MIDCDLASSTRVALDFCIPLIENTFMFFDDWAINDLAARGLGERKAFEGWLAANPEFVAQELPELQYAAKARGFLVTRRGGSDDDTDIVTGGIVARARRR